MGRTFLGFAVVVAALLALPRLVGAEDAGKKGPPGPEMLFKHIDKNSDGVISEDEFPADAPEPLQALLKAADKDGDKKITLEEFSAATKDNPLPRPHRGGKHGGPGDRPAPQGGMPMGGDSRGMTPPAGGPGMPMGPGMGRCMADGCSGPGMGPHRPMGPPHDGPRGQAPDPKELFAKLDADKDGKLTLEEFTEGLKQHGPGREGEPRGPRGPEACDGPSDGPGHDNPMKAKIDELEARLKTLEAAAEAKK